jgi:hypothetical protein
VEECFQQGKGQVGLDQHQLRLWHSFHRHTVLSMCALALLTVATARPRPQGPAGSDPPASSSADLPEHWRDTGALPAAPDQKPPHHIGMVRVSVPEARRLLNLATTPMHHAAKISGHAWSRWRRRHQARARWHHYQAQLGADPA